MFKKAQEKADQQRRTEVQVINSEHNNLKKSNLNNTMQPVYFLLVLQKEVLIELQTQVLKNFEPLMDLITKHEKKYRYRLSS